MRPYGCICPHDPGDPGPDQLILRTPECPVHGWREMPSDQAIEAALRAVPSEPRVYVPDALSAAYKVIRSEVAGEVAEKLRAAGNADVNDEWLDAADYVEREFGVRS